jgi:hypothetical protein
MSFPITYCQGPCLHHRQTESTNTLLLSPFWNTLFSTTTTFYTPLNKLLLVYIDTVHTIILLVHIFKHALAFPHRLPLGSRYSGCVSM